MEQFSILKRCEADFGYRLDDTALNRLERFRKLLIARSRQFNLTRVTDPMEIETRLFLDSLALMPHIRRLGSTRQAAGPVRLVDIGAGAGVPGLPLKIADAAIELTLIEATAKKVIFLREVITALDLDGVEAVHGRAEELAHDDRFRARFDVVTARGVARLPALIEICMPFCRVGGRGIFPKGREIDEEVQDASRAADALRCKILGVERPTVPELAGTSFVVVEQLAPPPERYPRRAGIPAKDPL